MLDVGCGVGGPLRAISVFSGASVVGLNNNEYQIGRAKAIGATSKHFAKCTYIKADFMTLPVASGEFDAAYEIEATCHAPDLRGVYGEIFRVLKPGGKFASYEWALTDSYDPSNETHKAHRLAIMKGNGLPDLRSTAECLQARARRRCRRRHPPRRGAAAPGADEHARL